MVDSVIVQTADNVWSSPKTLHLGTYIQKEEMKRIKRRAEATAKSQADKN